MWGRDGINIIGTALRWGTAVILSLGSVAASPDIRAFNLPAQSAGISIPEFARQAGRQIVAPGEKLRELHTPPLQGSMPIREALDILLQGTGLVVASDDGKLIILTIAEKFGSARQAEVVTPSGENETVTVTGFRASLASTANTKRAAVGFSDSVFAEDIGKFPYSNIAEAFNRIPGITISREIDGSGVNVAIRGLGPNFTKVLLNGAQVSIASTGPTNASNANREVDLNMFPVELFTQLTAYKSPEASQLEGGTAGTVNMRSLRPFDRPGPHLTYALNIIDIDSQDAPSPSGTLIVSDTIGPWGFLVGATNMSSRFFTRGVESVGWTTPLLSTTGPVIQCAPPTACNTIGGGNWVIPDIVPANVTTGGLVPGTKLDQAALLALNPDLSLQQLNNMLLPRLGRPFMEKGVRSRYNGVASLEYRPSSDFYLYLDMIGARASNNFDRSDINWVVRNGAAIPLGTTVDKNDVVTSGTFANAMWFLEARPYREYGDFYSINPGAELQAAGMLRISLQANASRSHFLRDSPTILLTTAPSSGNAVGVPGVTAPIGGVYVEYNSVGAATPSIMTNIDLNDPHNFQWAGGRVNANSEKRYVYTTGVHLDVQYGGSGVNAKVGFAYDEAYRNIVGYDNSQAWQNAVCGDSPNVFLPSPNSQPPCQGLSAIGGVEAVNTTASGYPTYPGLGDGYSAGYPTLTYRGSLIPQSALGSYLKPGPAGFINVDYAKFFKAANYSEFSYPNASVTGNTTLGVGSGEIDEKNYGIYGELNGELELKEHKLSYNFGLRWIDTLQSVSGPVSYNDPRNIVSADCSSLGSASCQTGSTFAALPDGALYPNVVNSLTTKRNYQAVLPSLNLTFAIWNDLQIRVAMSRTMTRANPNLMLPGLNFSDQSAEQAIIGNSSLKPYFSFNVDLGAEWYTGDEGYLSIALFRKSINGFVVNSTLTQPFASLAPFGITYATLNKTQQTAIDARGGPDVATVQLSQITNISSRLIIRGIELSTVQPLDVLLAQYGMEGFGVTANLTIVDQFSRNATVATGVSHYTYNLVGYYEHNGLSLHASYVFNDKQAFTDTNQNGICLPNIASGTCPGGARLYNSAYGQFDFSSSLKMSRLFGRLPSDPEVMFSAKNLTKSKLRSYFQYSNATYANYEPGTTYVFGVRGSF